MPIAYLLLNTEIKPKINVLEEIKKSEGVQEAVNLWGIYDIIVRIRADSLDKLTNIINGIIKDNKIHTKLTT